MLQRRDKSTTTGVTIPPLDLCGTSKFKSKTSLHWKVLFDRAAWLIVRDALRSKKRKRGDKDAAVGNDGGGVQIVREPDDDGQEVKMRRNEHLKVNESHEANLEVGCKVGGRDV